MKLVKETIYDVLTNKTDYIYYTDEKIEELKKLELEKVQEVVKEVQYGKL